MTWQTCSDRRTAWATSSPAMAQTSQVACVRITSGSRAARPSISRSKIAVEVPGSAVTARPTASWISWLLASGSTRGQVSAGKHVASAGQSHSWDRPTRRSPRPSAQAISVAAGRSETMRRSAVVMPAIVTRGGPVVRPAQRGGNIVVFGAAYQRPSRPRLTPCSTTPPLALIVPSGGWPGVSCCPESCWVGWAMPESQSPK